LQSLLLGAAVAELPALATNMKKKPKQKPAKAKKEKCFVIMPFGGYFDTYYDDVYIPAIEAAGLEPRRADDIFRPSPIINDIWELTKEAKIILADLSKRNANVFYELGMAHALSKPAILVTESLADVPFDLQSLRVLVYNKDEPDWGTDLSERIEKAIKEVLASPQSSVLPTFLSSKDTHSVSQISKRDIDIIRLRQEVAALRSEFLEPRSSRERARIDIGPVEAKDRIRSYLDRGMPIDMIIERVSRFGPPRLWVQREVEKAVASRKVEPPTASPTKTESTDGKAG
jgi:hypothetical protein